jgi:hypothetical protein
VGAETDEPGVDATYLDKVMAEIDDEVRARRASGDLPARVEQELDELFFEFSPVGATRRGEVSEVLRRVDANVFVDPVVPLESGRSGGAAIKKTVRSLTLWYVNFVVQQVNQFTSAVSRCLHMLEERIDAVERDMEGWRSGSTTVVEVAGIHRADAAWVHRAAAALSGAPGRVLHMACGDGWLVRALAEREIDAYGVDPRAEPVEQGEAADLDVRCEAPTDHLRSVAPQALGGVVLSGFLEAMTVAELRGLLELVSDCLAPDGVLVLHSLSPAWWASDDAPPAADLVPGHPLRPLTWHELLVDRGFEMVGPSSPGGPGGSETGTGRRRSRGQGAADYLVVARRREDVAFALG